MLRSVYGQDYCETSRSITVIAETGLREALVAKAVIRAGACWGLLCWRLFWCIWSVWGVLIIQELTLISFPDISFENCNFYPKYLIGFTGLLRCIMLAFVMVYLVCVAMLIIEECIPH